MAEKIKGITSLFFSKADCGCYHVVLLSVRIESVGKVSREDTKCESSHLCLNNIVMTYKAKAKRGGKKENYKSGNSGEKMEKSKQSKGEGM